MHTKLLLLCFSFLFSYSLQASQYKCTEWTQTRSITCIFAGSSAYLFERQCENVCWRDRRGRGNWGPGCDKEKVCHRSNPNTFKGVCSDWVELSGVSCHNPNTGRWEQKWKRSCTVGLKENWCSDKDPN